MAVDDRGLVHGGFMFGLADHAAMVAVNVPTVVLAAANVRFIAPVTAGDVLIAEGRVTGDDTVEVTVTRDDEAVMIGDYRPPTQLSRRGPCRAPLAGGT